MMTDEDIKAASSLLFDKKDLTEADRNKIYDVISGYKEMRRHVREWAAYLAIYGQDRGKFAADGGAGGVWLYVHAFHGLGCEWWRCENIATLARYSNQTHRFNLVCEQHSNEGEQLKIWDQALKGEI